VRSNSLLIQRPSNAAAAIYFKSTSADLAKDRHDLVPKRSRFAVAVRLRRCWLCSADGIGCRKTADQTGFQFRMGIAVGRCGFARVGGMLSCAAGSNFSAMLSLHPNITRRQPGRSQSDERNTQSCLLSSGRSVRICQMHAKQHNRLDFLAALINFAQTGAATCGRMRWR